MIVRSNLINFQIVKFKQNVPAQNAFFGVSKTVLFVEFCQRLSLKINLEKCIYTLNKNEKKKEANMKWNTKVEREWKSAISNWHVLWHTINIIEIFQSKCEDEEFE